MAESKSITERMFEHLIAWGVLVLCLLALGLVISLIFVGSPAALFLVAGLALYLTIRQRRGLLFGTARTTLKPVILGLSIPTLWLSLVRVLRPTGNLIRDFEECLTIIALRLETLSDLGPIWYGCILVSLMLLGSLLRNHQINRFGKPVKDAIDFSAVVLMTAASFTFFSQLPIEIRIHKDWDLEAKYRGWPKERADEQKKAERYLMIRLKEQIASLTPDDARQFRTRFHDIAEEEHPSKVFDYKHLSGADLAFPRYMPAPLAYPDFSRSEPIPETVAFDGISALPVPEVGSPHREPKITDPEVHVQTDVQGTNRDMLVALNTSFCDALSGATGKMLGSDSNIAIRFIKAVVELGAERLIENSAVNKLPLDIKTLLLPKTFVKEKMDPFLSWPLDLRPLRPKVLAFGFRARMENARIDLIILRGGKPSDSMFEGHVDDKPHQEVGHSEASHPMEFHPVK